MRYLDYLLGQDVSFTVADRASPQQVAERLRSQVRSRFWPFHFEKVVGRVGDESLSIEWRGGAFGRNVSPILRGRLVSIGAGTRFDGRFGAPVFWRFFLVIWVCFDSVFIVSMLRGSTDGQPTPIFVFPFLMVHLLFPFGITALGMIGADKIKQRLTDFVIDVGSARATPI